VQETVLTVAIQNPDASQSDIADHLGFVPGAVQQALRSWATGVSHADDGEHETFTQRRGNEPRKAEAFAELTRKQKAVIDYFARADLSFAAFTDASDRSVTGPKIADAIAESDRYDVSVGDSTPSSVLKTYGHLVADRRDEIDQSTDYDADRDGMTVRGYLTQGGWPAARLPDENRLDSLSSAHRDAPEPAFEQASDLDATGDRSRIPESHLGGETLANPDVTADTRYIGAINGFSDWCAWVTIGGDPSAHDDVSGRIPIEQLAAAGYDLDDLHERQLVVVVPTGGRNTSRGKVRHHLELVRPVTNDDGDPMRYTDAETIITGHADEAAAWRDPHMSTIWIVEPTTEGGPFAFDTDDAGQRPPASATDEPTDTDDETDDDYRTDADEVTVAVEPHDTPATDEGDASDDTAGDDPDEELIEVSNGETIAPPPCDDEQIERVVRELRELSARGYTLAGYDFSTDRESTDNPVAAALGAKVSVASVEATLRKDTQ